MKVQSNLVLIKVPVIPKSVIEMPEEAKAKWREEQMAKHMKLVVFEIGPEVTRCKKEDEVFIPNRVLKNADFFVYKDVEYWVIPESQIMIVF